MNRGATADRHMAPARGVPETSHRWHQMAGESVLTVLKSSPHGLTTREAQRRLAAVGPNELTEGKRRTPLRMFVDQFTDFMILLDDNFATIVRAVRGGRRIYDNIRRFVRYAVTTNSGEIWTTFLAPICGPPIPLLPIQILWINLVTDGLPGLALTAEPEESNVMRRPPRPPQESIFARGLGVRVLWVGPLMAGLVLGTQAWSLANGSSHWQTMVFTVLCLSQLAHILAIRSERESLFSQGLLSNPPLLGAVALTFALQLATIYVPALNRIFNTAALSPGELAAVIAIAALVFVAVEVEKWLKRRG
jgi:Ca2+-transporting ATPase